jgi:hypothetical protein
MMIYGLLDSMSGCLHRAGAFGMGCDTVEIKAFKRFLTAWLMIMMPLG